MNDKENKGPLRKRRAPGAGRPKGSANIWPEAKALQLCDDLIAWMKADAKNILWEKFLVFEKGLYKEVLAYLYSQYPSVAEKIDFAKKMQELKIIEGGLSKDLDKTISIFLLKTQHGYVETQHIQQNININKDDVPLFPDELGSDSPE